VIDIQIGALVTRRDGFFLDFVISVAEKAIYFVLRSTPAAQSFIGKSAPRSVMLQILFRLPTGQLETSPPEAAKGRNKDICFRTCF
jgi:hypothetical protein